MKCICIYTLFPYSCAYMYFSKICTKCHVSTTSTLDVYPSCTPDCVLSCTHVCLPPGCASSGRWLRACIEPTSPWSCPSPSPRWSWSGLPSRRPSGNTAKPILVRFSHNRYCYCVTQDVCFVFTELLIIVLYLIISSCFEFVYQWTKHRLHRN